MATLTALEQYFLELLNARRANRAAAAERGFRYDGLAPGVLSRTPAAALRFAPALCRTRQTPTRQMIALRVFRHNAGWNRHSLRIFDAGYAGAPRVNVSVGENLAGLTSHRHRARQKKHLRWWSSASSGACGTWGTAPHAAAGYSRWHRHGLRVGDICGRHRHSATQCSPSRWRTHLHHRRGDRRRPYGDALRRLARALRCHGDGGG
jgi:hypothetical protein